MLWMKLVIIVSSRRALNVRGGIYPIAIYVHGTGKVYDSKCILRNGPHMGSSDTKSDDERTMNRGLKANSTRFTTQMSDIVLVV